MKTSKINVEESNKVLETIASNFPRRSREYKALELAAKALLFVENRKTKQEFEVFLQSFNSELTPQQKRRLCEMRITSQRGGCPAQAV
jgi:hypothetical protein